MYELRIGDVPVGFHVHHKCENSGCVNPRHLVALSPEDHRAVHSTKDKTIKEQIYRGEWQKIQAAKAEAARLERERLERQWLERERQRLEVERQRLAEQESLRRTLKRKEQFDELFGTLRNGHKLQEQAAKSDEAWGPMRRAKLSGDLSRDHVQFFCDTYKGNDGDMISALLRSPMPNVIQLIALKIRDFCTWMLICAASVLIVIPFVIIVQIMFFRLDLWTAFLWAVGIVVLIQFVIDVRKA
jgi:hypothetical protein